jgi:putative endonuclease
VPQCPPDPILIPRRAEGSSRGVNANHDIGYNTAMPTYLYILKCRDGSYYTGTTRGLLEDRIAEHNHGKFPGAYTFRRRPVALAYSQEFDRITDAIAAERQIKNWSRAKKEALIAGDFERLKVKSRRGGGGG